MRCFPHLLSIISRLLKKMMSPSSFDMWSKWSRVDKRQNWCCCIRWMGISESDRKHRAFTKIKLSLTVHLLLCLQTALPMSLEMSWFMQIMTNTWFMWIKTSCETKESMFSRDTRNHHGSLLVMLFRTDGPSFCLFLCVYVWTQIYLRAIIIVLYYSSI